MTETVAVSNTPRRVMMSTATRNSKVEEAERELAELLAQRGEAPAEQTPTEVVETEAPVVTEQPAQQETGWEKRYKDAQRYINKLTAQVKELESKINATIKPPKSKDEVKAWMAKYPDIAAIVETIALDKAEEKAAEKYGSVHEQLSRFEEMRVEGIIARTEAAILKVHPDYLEIKDNVDFHKWAEDLPKAMQDALYDTIDDPKSVIKIINMYKLETGADDREVTSDRRAAASVAVRGQKQQATANRGSYDFLESDIEKMSIQEYQKNIDKINEARQKNRIKYDISGR